MQQSTEAARARRRAGIEAALARYPHLSPEAVKELTDWFAREASALDVGLIASNEELAEPWRRFRADHIDPLRPKDWLFGLALVIAVLAVFAALFWRAF